MGPSSTMQPRYMRPLGALTLAILIFQHRHIPAPVFWPAFFHLARVFVVNLQEICFRYARFY